jgi:hypothetical protein
VSSYSTLTIEQVASLRLTCRSKRRAHAEDPMKLYDNPFSPYAFKVRAALPAP